LSMTAVLPQIQAMSLTAQLPRLLLKQDCCGFS
jgi:hypothetical protein